ncbi:hypothetical protein D9Q98_000361 [Chlorella vulgaris]|uniref:Replication termination factor 2 n=1 Tax=Chlorella vulgaris TaxID=3077 RepID=A0A9D4TY12_CHLVU|nr:hypothetical protein D9Q98_000361 [Chlorella vulgaris]
MGLDGGTIISRNDVLRGQCWDLNTADTSRSSRGGAVRGTHKRRKLDQRTCKVTRWSTCALSGQPLAAPVVACFLGRLYNKAAVLEWLLARAGRFSEESDAHRYINQLREAGSDFDHITSMKDVFALQYEPSNGDAPAVATTANGAADPVLDAPFCCPITQLRCDHYPFVALRTCGHVLAERALKEAGADGTCPICGAPFSAADDDAVPLVPSEEQLERLVGLLPTRRRQGGKRKKGKRQQQGASAAAEAGDEAQAHAQQQQQQQQQQQPDQVGRSENGAAAAAAAAAAGKSRMQESAPQC